jgi:flavin-dependent thymidylate synthase
MQVTQEVEKWADKAMFHAAPQEAWDERTGVQPRVHLISMNEDPLGDIASMAGMYEGKVFRSRDEITDEDRRNYWQQISKSHLRTPFEAVKFNFLIEGVDRAFTHQIVRKRIGTSFAQESMRFAVPGDLYKTTTLPPSLFGTTEYGQTDNLLQDDAEKMRHVWDTCIQDIDSAYHRLVNMGMPAEEARGLLPTAVATRINMNVTLNTLIGMAGERLCTQAQFHWRSVFNQIVNQIRAYGVAEEREMDGWQFDEIASSEHFKPVCYQLGRCPWKASFDRGCTIRKRVDENRFDLIRDEEWMLNPYAAIVHSDADRPS